MATEPFMTVRSTHGRKFSSGRHTYKTLKARYENDPILKMIAALGYAVCVSDDDFCELVPLTRGVKNPNYRG